MLNMTKLGKGLVMAGLVTGGLALSGAASATCSVAGKVMNVWAYNSTYSYVGIAPQNSYGAGYVIYFYVPTSYSASNALHAAAASHDYVYAYGDATACPTTGTIRYGGTVQYVFSSNAY